MEKMNARIAAVRKEAIIDADAYLNNVDLPMYGEMARLVKQLLIAAKEIPLQYQDPVAIEEAEAAIAEIPDLDAYYYRPIPYYGGRVLKCAGIVSEDNAQWFPEKCADAGNGRTVDGYLPGFIVTDCYMGDRINADDLSVFKG